MLEPFTSSFHFLVALAKCLTNKDQIVHVACN